MDDISDETTHSAEEVRHVMARVNRAIMGMGVVSTAALNVLTAGTKVIVVRKPSKR